MKKDQYIFTGWLEMETVEQEHETITLDGIPVAEEMDVLAGTFATVRYYITDKECTPEQAQEDFLISTLHGEVDSDYGANYSEYTGYLWTDDELKVGGHDLRNELFSYVGKYLILIADIDMDKYKEDEGKRIKSRLRHLCIEAKEIGITAEELISEVKKHLK